VAKVRSPRFSRIPNPPKIDLTARDREIIRLVHHHRFLRSEHITALTTGSEQSVIRRLCALFHHGYLTRPRAQLEYFGRPGSRKFVYGLGNRGAKLLKEEGVHLGHLRWNEKNQDIGQLFLQHALAVSDVMVAFELAVRKIHGMSLIPSERLWNGKQFQWRVRLNSKRILGVVPDCTFALARREDTGRIDRTCYFLERDRGTMPIVRKNLNQTSMHRKFLAYHATWRNGIHKNKFGFDRFRVLVVTTSAARMEKLIEACQTLPSGFGLFLFSNHQTFKGHSDILSAPLKNGRGDPTTLLP
jgi:hypothetical protein